jgi:hypothetical protein
MALAPLRAVVEIDLTDVVTLHTTTQVDAGHGAETEEQVTNTGPFQGLLLPASAKVVEQAAARGIQATYLLQLPLGTIARPGMTATVVRDTTEESWTREIELTAVELPRSVNVVCTAVDVPLNQ